MQRRGPDRDVRSESDRTCRRGCRAAGSSCRRLTRGASRCHIASSSSGTPAPVDAGDTEEGEAELRRAPRRARRFSPRSRPDPPHRSCSRRPSAAWRPAWRRTAAARAGACRDPRPGRVRSRRGCRPGGRAPWCVRGDGGTGGRVPRPRCAPSINPGTSATTKLRSSLRPTTPRFGVSVVNGIVGDLRTRRRDARDERRLAGIRETDQADVGEQLQLEPQILFLARFAGLHFARRPIRRRREVRVADPAAAAARDEHALTFGRQIREQLERLVRVAGLFVDQRADRHGELEIVAALAGAVRSLTVSAAPGGQLGMKPVVDERVGVRAGDDEDRTAVAAVAAARAAARHELLAAERQTSPSAIASRDVNVDFVNEHGIW